MKSMSVSRPLSFYATAHYGLHIMQSTRQSAVAEHVVVKDGRAWAHMVPWPACAERKGWTWTHIHVSLWAVTTRLWPHDYAEKIVAKCCSERVATWIEGNSTLSNRGGVWLSCTKCKAATLNLKHFGNATQPCPYVWVTILLSHVKLVHHGSTNPVSAAVESL